MSDLVRQAQLHRKNIKYVLSTLYGGDPQLSKREMILLFDNLDKFCQAVIDEDKTGTNQNGRGFPD